MSTNEILIPTWLTPQAESSTLVDDSTSVFRAAYAPGVAQRVSYVEPRLQVKQTFQSLRAQERGPLLAALKRAKGKFGTVRAIVGYKNRGSFPTTEMFVNNDFISAANWSSAPDYSIASIDHGVRATRAAVTVASFAVAQTVSRTAGIPYALRGFMNSGKGSSPIFMADGVAGALGVSVMQGMNTAIFTAPSTGNASMGFFDGAASGSMAGNYFDAKWSSMSRCAQVDNGVNLLLNSDTPGTGTGWSLSGATAATGGGNLGPDGTADAWTLIETAATAAHFTFETTTVAAAAADFSVSWFAKANLRSWCFIEISNGVTASFQWFNLSTGALGSTSIGTGFAAISSQCVDYGNGWKRCIFTVRKTDASTSLLSGFAASTGDTVQTYAGSTASPALQTWRASFAQSSVPVAPVQTTSAAVTGTNQTGISINVKGLPLSVADNLLEDDLFEINGELKSAISPLSSDGAGLGTLFFAPALCRSPSDGDGVIINKPMGKFIIAADSAWQNDYGVYADIDITLEAINE